MKTIIRTFSFDTNTAEGKAAWSEFKAQRLAISRIHGPVFADCYSGFRAIDGTEITLETKHLFDNQWNAVLSDGREIRVFDFALQSDSAPNSPLSSAKGIRRGHYLEQTAEMGETRRGFKKCRYCGNIEPAANGTVFCGKCLSSPYLKQAGLALTRMTYIDELSSKIAPLSEAETAYLVPLWKDAQLKETGPRSLIAAEKKRREIEEKKRAAIEVAEMEFDGFEWLLNRGFNTENVIFYPHTKQFCFGWRDNGVDAEMKSAILNFISEFPFAYKIKVKGEKTLEGY